MEFSHYPSLVYFSVMDFCVFIVSPWLCLMARSFDFHGSGGAIMQENLLNCLVKVVCLLFWEVVCVKYLKCKSFCMM